MEIKKIVCIDTGLYPISLTKGKVYYCIEEYHGMWKIIDDTGEDYFFGKELFQELEEEK